MSEPVIPGCTTSAPSLEIEHRVLGAAGHPRMVAPVKRAEQPPPAHAAQDVVVAQRDSAEAAADEGGADVADDGFDFGELWHPVRK